MTLTVRPISSEDHVAFLRAQRSASFLQTPAWGRVKSQWRPESLGWYDDADHDPELVGAGLVLYRQLPRLKRYLAYLPEGPVLDWSTDRLDELLAPMAAHVKEQGAFGVRMGPPVVSRRWSTAVVKDGLANPAVRKLADLPPTDRDPVGARVVSQLTSLGWRPQGTTEGFALGQPQYVFQVPLAGRTEADVLAGMNQLWRRNIKKAEKAGVEVSTSTGRGDEEGDLKLFHDLYVHTAERDHFTPVSYTHLTLPTNREV